MRGIVLLFDMVEVVRIIGICKFFFEWYIEF